MVAGEEFRRGPEQHGDMGLFGWGQGIGEAMEVNSVFTQRFSVVGKIEHGCVGILGFEQVDDLAEDIVRINDSVVIGVDDGLLRAVLNVVLGALG